MAVHIGTGQQRYIFMQGTSIKKKVRFAQENACAARNAKNALPSHVGRDGGVSAQSNLFPLLSDYSRKAIIRFPTPKASGSILGREAINFSFDFFRENSPGTICIRVSLVFHIFCLLLGQENILPCFLFRYLCLNLFFPFKLCISCSREKEASLLCKDMLCSGFTIDIIAN